MNLGYSVHSLCDPEQVAKAFFIDLDCRWSLSHGDHVSVNEKVPTGLSALTWPSEYVILEARSLCLAVGRNDLLKVTWKMRVRGIRPQCPLIPIISPCRFS